MFKMCQDGAWQIQPVTSPSLSIIPRREANDDDTDNNDKIENHNNAAAATVVVVIIVNDDGDDVLDMAGVQRRRLC